MKNYTKIGSTLFGMAITGLGLVHLFYPGFRPVFLPVPAAAHITFPSLIFSLSLLMAGLGIIFSKKSKTIAFLLGVELSLFFLFGQLPNRLKYHPGILGVWTDAIKLIALIGGAFLIAGQSGDQNELRILKSLRKITPIGIYLFSIMLILFGIDHFFYKDVVRTLIPQWIPFKTFWTYFTGAALLGSGILIGLNLYKSQVSLLLALMLFLWLMLLHLPALFSLPDKDAVILVSSLECLAFCGIAIFLRGEKKTINYEKVRKSMSSGV